MSGANEGEGPEISFEVLETIHTGASALRETWLGLGLASIKAGAFALYSAISGPEEQSRDAKKTLGFAVLAAGTAFRGLIDAQKNAEEVAQAARFIAASFDEELPEWAADELSEPE